MSEHRAPEHLNPADPNPANTVSPLVGTTWVLSEWGGNRAVPIGVRSTLTLADDHAEVEAGCNRGRADVTIDDYSLVFGPLALTRMMCADDAMAVEAEVCAVLQGTVPYARQGHALQLGPEGRFLIYRSDIPRGES